MCDINTGFQMSGGISAWISSTTVFSFKSASLLVYNKLVIYVKRGLSIGERE
jgi:hypothetical protein